MTIVQAIGAALACFSTSVALAMIIAAAMHRCREPGEDGPDELPHGDVPHVSDHFHSEGITK